MDASPSLCAPHPTTPSLTFFNGVTYTLRADPTKISRYPKVCNNSLKSTRIKNKILCFKLKNIAHTPYRLLLTTESCNVTYLDIFLEISKVHGACENQLPGKKVFPATLLPGF